MRSTLPKTMAELPVLARSAVHGAVRSEVYGEAVTSDARSVAGDWAEALSGAGAAGQGERGEDGDGRGARNERR